MEAPSLAETLAANPQQAEQFLAALSDEEARALEYDWSGFWARPKQVAPAGHWIIWLILAGRGFGKTRTGAEWITEGVEDGTARRIALVAETAADARDVMVEGPSGVLACAKPWNPARYEPSKRRVTWKNGAQATTFSADEPDQIRGPEHDRAWGDEVAKWRYTEALDNLRFGLRIGVNPQAVLTTTPKPVEIIKSLVRDSDCILTRGSTNENRGNLAPQFVRAIFRKYAGSRMGRQELEAELLDDAPGALWKRAQIDKFRVKKPPQLVRVVVAIDPSVSSTAEGAETGIIVAGLGEDGHGYVLHDGTLEQPTPKAWGDQAVALFELHKADRVIGEANNGGDLVESNVRASKAGIPFTKVWASRGKATRADPISTLAEQGRIHHVGSLALLEDQLCQWEPRPGVLSPNRLDAYVWAFTELMSGSSVSVDDWNV